MGRARTVKKGLGTVIFLVGVIALAVWAGTQSSQVAGDSQTPTAPASPTPQILGNTTSPSSAAATTASIIYEPIVEVRAGGIGQLVAVNLTSKERRVLYTDQDEPNKLQLVGNLDAGKREALALVGPGSLDFGAKLVAINLDGSGKVTPLMTDFASPWPPVANPDGTKIAFVSFSNAEADYGFSLVLARRDGTDRKILIREALPITQPVFHPDGTRLAYIRQTNYGGGGEVVSIPASGGTSETLATFTDRLPYDIAWAADGSIAFIDGAGDQGDLFGLGAGAKTPERLSGLPGQESRPVYSPDGKKVLFTLLKSGKGTLYELDRASGKATELGSATAAIGWLPARR